jgi:hypothetical protein
VHLQVFAAWWQKKLLRQQKKSLPALSNQEGFSTPLFF